MPPNAAPPASVLPSSFTRPLRRPGARSLTPPSHMAPRGAVPDRTIGRSMTALEATFWTLVSKRKLPWQCLASATSVLRRRRLHMIERRERRSTPVRVRRSEEAEGLAGRGGRGRAAIFGGQRSLALRGPALLYGSSANPTSAMRTRSRTGGSSRRKSRWAVQVSSTRHGVAFTRALASPHRGTRSAQRRCRPGPRREPPRLAA